MNKIKSLLPSLKEKKRYILVQSNKIIEKGEFYKKMKNILGEFGLARSGLNLVLIKKMSGIIQVGHKFVDETCVALELNDFRVMNVSGVINKLKGGLL